jgi:archaellum component FlaF (FlaF/FlaG flagellin family)
MKFLRVLVIGGLLLTSGFYNFIYAVDNSASDTITQCFATGNKKVKGVCQDACSGADQSKIKSKDCDVNGQKKTCCGTKARKKQPPVSHGGILAGPEQGKNASKYVINKFLPKITNTLLTIMLAGSVLMLVWAGILYISSGGDSETIEKAKTTFTWAMLGVVIGILALTIVKLVIGINFFG